MQATDVLGGPNAIGRAGDVLLENDEVAFVISQISGAAGFAESGGNLVDAADAKLRKDLDYLALLVADDPRGSNTTSLAELAKAGLKPL